MIDRAARNSATMQQLVPRITGVRVISALCALVLLAACGGNEESSDGATDSAGAAAEVEDETGSEPGARSTPTFAPTTTAVSVTSPAERTEVTSPAEPSAVMPDVPCGTDLQLAQDLLQEAGVFLSQSVDATGEDRSQVMDRNWTVVRSEPPAGSPIEEDDPVFYVVKDGEFTGC